MSPLVTVLVFAPVAALGIVLMVWHTVEVNEMKKAVMGHSMIWRGRWLQRWDYAEILRIFVEKTGDQPRVTRANLMGFASMALIAIAGFALFNRFS